jgi:hypothetical protein
VVTNFEHHLNYNSPTFHKYEEEWMLWVVQDLRYRWVLSHNYFVADEYRNGRALGAHHGARSIRQLAVGAGENL